MLNSILDGSYLIPQNWLTNRVVLRAKVAVPTKPADLRPIVVSTTACAIFTKILLLRLRPKFPDTAFGQLCGIQSSQTLDGSLAAQQLVHLSDAYGLPLVLVKINVKAAFDSVPHTAVAGFLTQSEICLSFGPLPRTTVHVMDNGQKENSSCNPVRRSVRPEISSQTCRLAQSHRFAPLCCQVQAHAFPTC